VEGGDDSVNVQAGQDIALTIHQGASLDEVKTYVNGLFAENFIKLTGAAERIAEERAQKITDDFLQRAQDEDPQILNSLGDPAMLSAVYDAQSSYAKSGEEDLAEVLVDLLVDRSRESGRNLRAIVLEGAIPLAPKITQVQREVLGAVFVARHVTVRTTTQDDFIAMRIRQAFLPLTVNLDSVSKMDLQHLEYLGCGSISVAGTSLVGLLANSAHFSKGFDPLSLSQELQALGITEPHPDPLVKDRVVFSPWVHDPRHVAGGDALLAPVKEEIEQTILHSMMEDTATTTELRRSIPQIDELLAMWNKAGLHRFTLTSVGIAIGHAYWKRVSGLDAPLSTWIH
jgi:hypothetical protein